jgi:hypothetical protein
MSDYPKCGNCKDGVLVPFFLADGRNAYACTECRTIFHLTVPKGSDDNPEVWKAGYTITEDFNV